MKDWTSLFGHIDPAKVGKLLVVCIILAFTLTATAQSTLKPVMVDVIEGTQIVKKAATLAQVTAKMTKTQLTSNYNGKDYPVYTTGKTYYVIVELTNGIGKKRLNIVQ